MDHSHSSSPKPNVDAPCSLGMGRGGIAAGLSALRRNQRVIFAGVRQDVRSVASSTTRFTGTPDLPVPANTRVRSLCLPNGQRSWSQSSGTPSTRAATRTTVRAPRLAWSGPPSGSGGTAAKQPSPRPACGVRLGARYLPLDFPCEHYRDLRRPRDALWPAI